MGDITFTTSEPPAKITDYDISGNPDGGSPLTHTGTDSAGNSMRAVISNPSGFVNVAEINCANGDTINIRNDKAQITDLIAQFREGEPSTALFGLITVSEGQPSPLPEICGNAATREGR